MLGNDIPTRKLHSQFRSPAMDIAGGRGPCLNNSPPINCGIEPIMKNIRDVIMLQTLDCA